MAASTDRDDRFPAPTGPKVSIGIPVYNGEQFIADALDSILAQSFEDFEVVICDNASTDRTEEICRSYEAKDERVRYSRNGRNIGIVANFNVAFYLSRGRYFKWAAHDDLLASQYLEKCVAVLDSMPSVVLVTPRVGLIDVDGTPVQFDEAQNVFITKYGEKVHPIDPPRDYGLHSPTLRFREVVLHLRLSVLTAYVYGLVRADALASTQLHRSYVGTEKVVVAHLSLLGRLYEVPEQLFFWRMHPEHVGATRAPQASRTQIADIAEVTKKMDPRFSGKVAFMGPRQVAGYLWAIRHAPIGPGARARCAMAVAEKLGRAAMARGRRVLLSGND